jgi:hypothetical protein
LRNLAAGQQWCEDASARASGAIPRARGLRSLALVGWCRVLALQVHWF